METRPALCALWFDDGGDGVFFDAGRCGLPAAVCSTISRFGGMSRGDAESRRRSSIVGDVAEFVGERECGCIGARDMLPGTPGPCAARAMRSFTGRAEGGTGSDWGNGVDMAGLEG